MKSNVKKYTDQSLLQRMSSLPSFKGYPYGYFDIWVRSNEDAYNIFDDKVYTYYYNGNDAPQFIMCCTGTSNAGSFGLKRFFKYNSKGCAILKSNVIVYDSHILGKHKGKYPAYIQSYKNPFPYYRDFNKNHKAEELGPIFYNRIGANCHKAGWFSKYINNWSLGCLVRNQQKQFNLWMETLNKQPTLTVCILKEF